MRKKLFLLIILLSVVILSGCGKNMTAKEAVADYLEMYITLDNKVVSQLDEYVNKEDLSDDQKNTYKSILKKQYTTMNYNVIGETYNGDTAYVRVKVNVMDLYKVQKESDLYLEEHKDEFNDDNGVYDAGKYIAYKLKQMKEATETTEYEIEFKVVKTNNNWEVSQLSNDDLEKIHGIYNYEK